MRSAAEIVLRAELSRTMRHDLSYKQAEYIKNNYPDVLLYPGRNRISYPTILREALEYEQGFRR